MQARMISFWKLTKRVMAYSGSGMAYKKKDFPAPEAANKKPSSDSECSDDDDEAPSEHIDTDSANESNSNSGHSSDSSPDMDWAARNHHDFEVKG